MVDVAENGLERLRLWAIAAKFDLIIELCMIFQRDKFDFSKN